MLTLQRLKLTRRRAVPAPGKDHQDKLKGFWLVPNRRVTKVHQSPSEHTELFREGCARGKSTGQDTGRAVSQAQPQLSREGGFCAQWWVRSCRNTAGQCWLLAPGKLVLSPCATGKPLQKSSLEITPPVRRFWAGIYALQYKVCMQKIKFQERRMFQHLPLHLKSGSCIRSIQLEQHYWSLISWLRLFIHQFYLFSIKELFNLADFCSFPGPEFYFSITRICIYPVK